MKRTRQPRGEAIARIGGGGPELATSRCPSYWTHPWPALGKHQPIPLANSPLRARSCSGASPQRDRPADNRSPQQTESGDLARPLSLPLSLYLPPSHKRQEPMLDCPTIWFRGRGSIGPMKGGGPRNPARLRNPTPARPEPGPHTLRPGVPPLALVLVFTGPPIPGSYSGSRDGCRAREPRRAPLGAVAWRYPIPAAVPHARPSARKASLKSRVGWPAAPRPTADRPRARCVIAVSARSTQSGHGGAAVRRSATRHPLVACRGAMACGVTSWRCARPHARLPAGRRR